MFSSDFWKGRGEWKKRKKRRRKKKIFPRRHGWLKTGLRTCHMSQAISRCKREEALWPAFGVRDIGFHARSCSFKPDGATSSPHCTSHHHPPRSQPWERMRPRSPGMAVGLRNASRLLRSGLQSRDVCASQARATASVRRSGVTNMCAGTGQARGGLSDFAICQNGDKAMLRGPSRLWHTSETRLGRWMPEPRSRRAMTFAGLHVHRRFLYTYCE